MWLRSAARAPQPSRALPQRDRVTRAPRGAPPQRRRARRAHPPQPWRGAPRRRRPRRAETRVPLALLRHGLGDPRARRLLGRGPRGPAGRSGPGAARGGASSRASASAEAASASRSTNATRSSAARSATPATAVAASRRGALQVLDAQEKRVALALDVAEGRRRRGLGARILILVSVRVDASRIGRVPAVAVARLVAVKGGGAYARGERIERPALGGARAPTLARLLRGAHSDNVCFPSGAETLANRQK